MSVFRGQIPKSSRRGARISGSLPGSDSALLSWGWSESVFPEQSEGDLARPLLDRIALHPPLSGCPGSRHKWRQVSFLSLFLMLFGRRQWARCMPRATRIWKNNEARLYSAGLNQGFIDQTMAWR
jgi:hypothetical protein